LVGHAPPTPPPSSPGSNGVRINSRIDLNTLVEVFRVKGDERVFSRCTFSFIDDDDRVFSGVAGSRKWDISCQEFQDALRRVPDREAYPDPPAGLTVFAAPRADCFFVKRPNLASYDDVRGTDYLARLMLHEIATLEHLRANPHPGLARYHGCVVARGRVAGIVLSRYQATLDGWLRRGVPVAFDGARCMRDVRAAVEHLHALGYAHNDLNPHNIMVDEDDDVVVIDFGSCQPVGARLMSTGTYGWIDDEFTTSEKEHDLAALDKIEAWLEDAVGGRFWADGVPSWAL
jgi:Protein kinase domain